jgi:hypothetical protein
MRGQLQEASRMQNKTTLVRHFISAPASLSKNNVFVFFME